MPAMECEVKGQITPPNRIVTLNLNVVETLILSSSYITLTSDFKFQHFYVYEYVAHIPQHGLP